jgi:D-lactate dehydrogenase
MKTAIFNTRSYDRPYLEAANQVYGHELVLFETELNQKTAALGLGFPAVSVKTPSKLDEATLGVLAQGGTRFIALRSAGFDFVDIAAAHHLGMKVVRVPAYSPYAIAEHTVGLILSLNRKIHRAYGRVRDGNLSLDGLVGFDLHGKTVGLIGTGKIGLIVARIMKGFGCDILAYSRTPKPEIAELGGKNVTLPELYAAADIISLHCPLTPETFHLIDAQAINQMKPGVMIINTSRGGLIYMKAVIQGLKSGQVGYLGLDVYEREANLFQQDLSNKVIEDDVFERLITFPNVIVTGHQAWLTQEALQQIAKTTLANLADLEQGRRCPNEITADQASFAKEWSEEEIEQALLAEQLQKWVPD